MGNQGVKFAGIIDGNGEDLDGPGTRRITSAPVPENSSVHGTAPVTADTDNTGSADGSVIVVDMGSGALTTDNTRLPQLSGITRLSGIARTSPGEGQKSSGVRSAEKDTGKGRTPPG